MLAAAYAVAQHVAHQCMQQHTFVRMHVPPFAGAYRASGGVVGRGGVDMFVLTSVLMNTTAVLLLCRRESCDFPALTLSTQTSIDKLMS